MLLGQNIRNGLFPGVSGDFVLILLFQNLTSSGLLRAICSK